MISITDMTLDCISEFSPTRRQLERLLALLLAAGADAVEMPAAVYDRINPPPSDRYILRINSPDEAANYPEAARFVCRKRTIAPNPSIMSEIQVNNAAETTFSGRLGDFRVTGLDDVLFHDYPSIFEAVRSQARGRIEFCPGNDLFCATAAAVEWISSGGTHIAAAFGGLGGKAALEEVLVCLWIGKKYGADADYVMFPEISALIEAITGAGFSAKKPVIGKSIFSVESGIHIDGILKNPETYEPFPPELVGRSRKFVIGKHSGISAICSKLHELGLDPEEYDCAGLLCDVKDKSIEKLSWLTDDECRSLALGRKK